MESLQLYRSPSFIGGLADDRLADWCTNSLALAQAPERLLSAIIGGGA